MAQLDWMPALAVGNKVIDEQHRSLFALINRLDEALGSHRERPAVITVIQELGDYVRDHFGLEERLFVEKAYPGAEAHIQEHGGFVARIMAFQMDYLAGKSELTPELVGFLKAWLTNHISLTDRKYRPWLSDKA